MELRWGRGEDEGLITAVEHMMINRHLLQPADRWQALHQNRTKQFCPNSHQPLSWATLQSRKSAPTSSIINSRIRWLGSCSKINDKDMHVLPYLIGDSTFGLSSTKIRCFGEGAADTALVCVVLCHNIYERWTSPYNQSWLISPAEYPNHHLGSPQMLL